MDSFQAEKVPYVGNNFGHPPLRSEFFPKQKKSFSSDHFLWQLDCLKENTIIKVIGILENIAQRDFMPD